MLCSGPEINHRLGRPELDEQLCCFLEAKSFDVGAHPLFRGVVAAGLRNVVMSA